MRLVRTAEAMPSVPGVYWVIATAKVGVDVVHLLAEDKAVASWDGEQWRYTEDAPEHCIGEMFPLRVIAWVCIREEGIDEHGT